MKSEKPGREGRKIAYTFGSKISPVFWQHSFGPTKELLGKLLNRPKRITAVTLEVSCQSFRCGITSCDSLCNDEMTVELLFLLPGCPHRHNVVFRSQHRSSSEGDSSSFPNGPLVAVKVISRQCEIDYKWAIGAARLPSDWRSPVLDCFRSSIPTSPTDDPPRRGWMSFA